jgi:hypothetical protein
MFRVLVWCLAWFDLSDFVLLEIFAICIAREVESGTDGHSSETVCLSIFPGFLVLACLIFFPFRWHKLWTTTDFNVYGKRKPMQHYERLKKWQRIDAMDRPRKDAADEEREHGTLVFHENLQKKQERRRINLHEG